MFDDGQFLFWRPASSQLSAGEHCNGFKSVSERQFIFGTATRSLNASQSSNGTKTTGHTYTTLEAGFGHVLSNETQLTVAYRMQDLKFPDGGYAKLGGIIFGANFNF